MADRYSGYYEHSLDPKGRITIPSKFREQLGKTIAMMRGNKWRLFCLDFSFIGWIILCALTLGILTFWIMPYMHTARAEFYQDLLAREYAAYQARNAAAQAAAGGDTTSGTAQAAAGENAANAAQEAIGEGPANDAQ